MLDEDDLPASTHALLGPDHSSRIQTLVLDMVETSAAADDIRMSEPVWNAMMDCARSCSSACTRRPSSWKRSTRPRASWRACSPTTSGMWARWPQEYRAISDGDDARAVSDYIAGMTDRSPKSQFQNLFVPHSLHF